MRCLRPDTPEDVDRVARVVSDNDWRITEEEDKEFDRQSAVWVLTEFSIIVPPDDEYHPPEDEY